MRNETKVGLFVIGVLAILGFMTLKVGGGSSLGSGGYDYSVVVGSALGINDKTPVLIAGYQAGVVSKIKLVDSRQAALTLRIQKGVVLNQGTQAAIRAKGFLGETYIELIPGPADAAVLEEGAVLPFNGVGGDVNQMIAKFNDIAGDVKDVSAALKDMVANGENSPAYRAINNLDKFAEIMKEVMVRNEQNVNRILENFAALSQDLRGAGPNVNEATERIASITQKVDQGKGTLGKLINEDKTYNKINDAADSVNNLLGGVRRMETQIGFHSEYMGTQRDFKNYVHLNLIPRPDQAFLIDFVTNPNPPPSVSTTSSTITAGGASTTVSSVNSVTNRNKFLVSAQIAKKFYDWRLRGGIIESRGGVGVDYSKGPIGGGVSVWDFGSNDGRHPQVKAFGNVNVTKSLYLTGGGNDLANSLNTRSWFIGGGVQIVDDDVKGLLGMSNLVNK